MLPNNWSEGRIHIAMRNYLRNCGWQLIAGEYPGGSDHELYPLNVVDPAIARDESPDPRRHSYGELIPDIVALNGRFLLLGEAKVFYNEQDRQKLAYLITSRREDLILSLNKFAQERNKPNLLPIETLVFYPTLVFLAKREAPTPLKGLSYLRILDKDSAYFEGDLSRDMG